jgi:predicted alpha/beta hydrolase family esterase
MTVIILHGTKGSPHINWFPWLRQQLQARGETVHVPHLPTPDSQTPAAWHTALAAQCPPIDSSTTLVGHSLGANFILHILERLIAPVAQSIFVAPVIDDIAFEEYSHLNEPFTHHLYDWPRIRTNAGVPIILHGTDDPYVPPAQATRLQYEIGGLLNLIPNGGHLNGEAGYTEFPLLLRLFDNDN